MSIVKPCPFCQGTNVKFTAHSLGPHSNKFIGAMYCKDCHCYGPQIEQEEPDSDAGESYNPLADSNFSDKAIKVWNSRGIERIFYGEI